MTYPTDLDPFAALLVTEGVRYTLRSLPAYLMAKRTPHTSQPAEAVPVKVWILPELLAWLDAEAEAQDRSRAYLVNEAIRHRMTQLERRRRRDG